MKGNEFTKEEVEINYNLIKKIEKHAQSYSIDPDKKSFLRNACAYEQKYILMNSEKPYEVLKYLDKLDLKSSRLILEELNYNEIKKLLELFTTEDKKEFYETFSDLSLINQFIEKDENATEHIKELPVNRKINILNSSKSDTILATSIVYDSIPLNVRENVVSSLTNVDAINALNQTVAYKEDKIISEIKNEHIDEIINEKKVAELEKEEIKENLKKEFDEQVKEQCIKDMKEIELNKMKKQFFIDRIQHYKENIPEFKNLDFDDKDLFEKLPLELLAIVEKDFQEYEISVKVKEKFELDVENKYDKMKKNVNFLKDSSIKDLILRINSIAIFNNICMANEDELKLFKEKCPQLYEVFSQYFGESNVFDSLPFDEQTEIIQKIQKNKILSDELNKSLENINLLLKETIKSKFELEKNIIFNEFFKNNHEVLELLNIVGKSDYSEFMDDEKLRVEKYFSNNVEILKKLKKLGDDIDKDYNLDSKCIKENVSFSDLLLSVSDKEKFKTYLTPFSKDLDIMIDSNGNLTISNKKPKIINVSKEYEKYSIIGNGEKRVNLVTNKKLLNLFESKKQNCENDEISKLMQIEGLIHDNSKTL